MNCSLTGSCVDVTLEAYKAVPAGSLPFVVIQYVVSQPNENGKWNSVIYFVVRLWNVVNPIIDFIRCFNHSFISQWNICPLQSSIPRSCSTEDSCSWSSGSSFCWWVSACGLSVGWSWWDPWLILLHPFHPSIRRFLMLSLMFILSFGCNFNVSSVRVWISNVYGCVLNVLWSLLVSVQVVCCLTNASSFGTIYLVCSSLMYGRWRLCFYSHSSYVNLIAQILCHVRL